MQISLRPFFAAFAFVVALCGGAPADASSRIKDLANIEGVRQNQLIGYMENAAQYDPAELEQFGADVQALCERAAAVHNLKLDFRQSNHEGVLIDWVHEAFEAGWAVVGNFGGYTHTSIALMDALAVVTAPVVEVHISDIHAREEFRRTSYVSLVADDHVIGQGVAGYAEALRRVAHLWA